MTFRRTTPPACRPILRTLPIHQSLSMYEVANAPFRDTDCCIMICDNCRAQIEKKAELDSKHWQCPDGKHVERSAGVQVVAWRMLEPPRLGKPGHENLDMPLPG